MWNRRWRLLSPNSHLHQALLWSLTATRDRLQRMRPWFIWAHKRPCAFRTPYGAKRDISAGDNSEAVSPAAMENNDEAKYMVMLYRTKDIAAIRVRFGANRQVMSVRKSNADKSQHLSCAYKTLRFVRVTFMRIKIVLRFFRRSCLTQWLWVNCCLVSNSFRCTIPILFYLA